MLVDLLSAEGDVALASSAAAGRDSEVAELLRMASRKTADLKYRIVLRASIDFDSRALAKHHNIYASPYDTR